jgi:ABC-type multidrug transport system fused ATPase/permease subunit
VVLQSAFVISTNNIKDNLDAEGRYSDNEINEALEKACLGEFNSRSMTSSLSTG